jgi:hypothetical protein
VTSIASTAINEVRIRAADFIAVAIACLQISSILAAL